MRPHESAVVPSIHDSFHASSKSDDLDRLVERLDDSVTLHVVFHGLSAKEIVQRSAALNCLPVNRLEVV